MPHICLEYSQNVDLKTKSNVFFKACHEFLARELPTDLSSCQSRAICHQDFYIGDGAAAFLHLVVKIKSGRTAELKERVAVELLRLLDEKLLGKGVKCKTQISVELRDLSDHYQKLVVEPA